MKIKSLIKLREYIAGLPGLCGGKYFSKPGEWRYTEGPCCAVGAAILLIDDDNTVNYAIDNQYRSAILQLDGRGHGLIQEESIEPKFVEFFGKNAKQMYSFFEKLQDINDDKSDGLSGIERKEKVLKFIDETIDSLRRKK